MAIRYVNDGGSNTDPYDTLAKAATTMAVAIIGASTNAVAGDDFYVGMDHAEAPGSTITYTFPGTASAPNRVISINTTTENYDKADNVQIDTSGGVFDLIINGQVKFYGISLKVGDDLIMVGGDDAIEFYDSLLELSSVNAVFDLGNASGRNRIKLKITDVNFSGGGSGGKIRNDRTGMFEWNGGTLSWSGTQPTALFDDQNRTVFISVAGVDLSSITSALVDVSSPADILAEFHHNVINSGVSLTVGTISNVGTKVLMSGCDDTTGNDLYRLEYVDFYGSIVHDDAIFVTTDGASDGTTPISWKMVTTGNAKEFSEPLISPPIPIWISSTGSKTFTIKGIWDSASDIQTDEAWLEIEFLDAAANTNSTFADDGLANILATPADQTNNTETWTGTGGFTNENKIDLAVTATVNRVGPALARIHLAKPSTTFYADPKIIVS